MKLFNAVIGFIIGYVLGWLARYIKARKHANDTNRPKTLNIGCGSDDTIHVTSGMIILEIERTSDIHNFDLNNMDDIIFYISSSNKYIQYKDKEFRYVKLDIPLH